MSYPKWVQRAPYIGAVLCANAQEEKQLLDDWYAETGEAPQQVEAPAASAEQLAAIETARQELKTERSSAEEWFAEERQKLEAERAEVARQQEELAAAQKSGGKK